MTIAFCLKDNDADSALDARFGRAEYFLFYNTESGNANIVSNEAKNAPGGAGAKAVQQMVDNGTECLIAPEVGPQAHDALEAFGIPAYKQGDSLSFRDALSAWEKGDLHRIDKPGNKGLHRA